MGKFPVSILQILMNNLTKVPARVPYYTIINTHEDHAWLVNFLETPMSTAIWDMCTVATIGTMYREVLNKYALETTGSTEMVQWQGHDFSMRGRSSMESTLNQAGWLLSFTGTDTIPAVLMIEKYYNGDITKELIGSSVPASEHSVMTSYGKEAEINAFERLLEQFPTGILSVVSDSFDLWAVLTEFLPKLKDKILVRDGKLVIRPDSGDPVDIICGNEIYANREEAEDYMKSTRSPQQKGVIELLWDVFGGTINEQGYKVLDSHIGAIYGDSITLARAGEICERLKTKGFASTNIVLGVGSYTMNYNTRDSLGIAVKSTWCEVYEYKSDKDGNIIKVYEGREIFKDPVTDDGVKKSAKGLLQVIQTNNPHVEENGEIWLKDQCTWQQEDQGLLEVVFLNGKLLKDQNFSNIKARVNS